MRFIIFVASRVHTVLLLGGDSTEMIVEIDPLPWSSLLNCWSKLAWCLKSKLNE